MSLSHLGKRLKAERVKQGLSLRALELIVGVSFSGLARIERGVGNFTADTHERVLAWLETGARSEKKERKGRAWFLTFEQRLARIEAALGLSAEAPADE